MALFGKLFSKEACGVCGTEAGTLKRKKIADGYICKECAGRCSAWFDDFKETPLASIQEQIAYREGPNQQLLDAFNTTQAFGEYGMVFIDEPAGLFTAVPSTARPGLLSKDKTVPETAQDVRDQNPDVFKLSDIRDVDLNISQTYNEDKRTVDGEQVSYDPRRWIYMCDFSLQILVDHPYVKRISVPLNSAPVRIVNEGERERSSINERIAKWTVDTVLGGPGVALKEDRIRYADESLLAQLMRSDYEIPSRAYGFKVDPVSNWKDIKRYRHFLAMAYDARNALLAGRG